MKNIKNIWGLAQEASRYATGFAKRSAYCLASLQSPTLPQRYADYRTQLCFKILFLISLMLMGADAEAQLSLEEAIELAWQEHSLIQQRDLQIEQQATLKNTRKQLHPTTFTYSWEELDPTFNQAIYSLNIQQKFNLPAVAKSQKNYQNAQVRAAKAQKEMTKNDLRREISRIYQQLCWQQSRYSLQQDLLALFQDFERIASRQAQLGETGQLPVLAASRAAAQAQLDLQNWKAEQVISLEKYKLWLPKEQGIKDSMIQLMTIDTTKGIEDNPSMAFYREQITVEVARKKIVASQLKPQIVTGLRLQMINGEAPFFGGQIGCSAPLFRKGYKAQLNAVDLAVAQQREQLSWQEQQLERQIELVLKNIQKIKMNLKFYDQEFFPLYEKQIALAKKAYELGELNYNDYLEELLRYAQSQRVYWDNILAHNLWTIELNHLSNQNP